MDFCLRLCYHIWISLVGRTMSKKDLPDFGIPQGGDSPPNALQGADTGTETIDLEGLSEAALTP